MVGAAAAFQDPGNYKICYTSWLPQEVHIRSGCVTKGQRSTFKWWLCFLKDGPLFHSCWPFKGGAGWSLRKDGPHNGGYWSAFVGAAKRAQKLRKGLSIPIITIPDLQHPVRPFVILGRTRTFRLLILFMEWSWERERGFTRKETRFVLWILHWFFSWTGCEFKWSPAIVWFIQREFNGGLLITEGWYHPNPQGGWI